MLVLPADRSAKRHPNAATVRLAHHSIGYGPSPVGREMVMQKTASAVFCIRNVGTVKI
jgi:hypothetical protein